MLFSNRFTLLPRKNLWVTLGFSFLTPITRVFFALTLMSYHAGFVATVPTHSLLGFPEDTWSCCHHQVLVFLSIYLVTMWAFRDTTKLCFHCYCRFFLDLRFQRVCWLPCGWETVAGEGTEDWLGSCHDNVRRGRNGRTKLHYGDEEQRWLQNILERENQQSLLMDWKWSVRKTEHYSTDLSLHIKDQLAIF